MTEIIIWDPFERFLWSVAITVLFIAGLHFLNKGLKRENQSEKLILFGFASLFFGLTIYRLCFFIFEITIPGAYRNNAFYGDYEELARRSSGLIYIPLIIGYFLFVLFFEAAIKHTKYILSLIGVIFITIMIIFPILLTNQIFLMIAFLYMVSTMFIILLYLTKYSPLEFKAIASLILFGITLMFIGMGLRYSAVRRTGAVPSYIAPTLVIIGTLITISPVRFNPKTYKETLIYWVLIGGSTFGILILFVIQIIIAGVPTSISIAISLVTLLLVVMVYRIIKIIISQAPGKFKAQRKGVDLNLSMFSRPQKLTEEEVTVSKEKKICLVCKNKVFRLNYICPECYALYCVKCSDVLSDLENACWVCETPFDETKPVRIERLKELEVISEDKTNKDNK